jgi:hypothetical protein
MVTFQEHSAFTRVETGRPTDTVIGSALQTMRTSNGALRSAKDGHSHSPHIAALRQLQRGRVLDGPCAGTAAI